MEYLQEFGALDTVKNALYLFFGMVLGYGFWEFCERYTKGEISFVNPILFVVLLVWSTSGFFFFPYSQHPIMQLLCYAIPDWDIPLSTWIQFDFLQHRSVLFSSILIPIVLLGIAMLLTVFRRYRSFNTFQRILRLVLSSLRTIVIGLSVGISTHLLGDLLLQWIPIGDTDIEIYEFDSIYALVWLFVNLVFGLVFPFLIIRIQKIRLILS